MNRYINLNFEQAYTAITEILSNHCAKIRLNSTVNLQNLNVFSERVVEILLNNLYGFQLSNANKIRANNPGCDLVDDVNKIVVSVSSQKNKGKIQKDIDSLSSVYPGYRLIYFCLTDDEHGLRKRQYDSKEMDFDPYRDVFDFKLIMSDIFHEKEIKGILLLLIDELGLPASLSSHSPEIYLDIYLNSIGHREDKRLLGEARVLLEKEEYKAALVLINSISRFSREVLMLKAGIESKIKHEFNPIKTLDLIINENPRDIEALDLKAQCQINMGECFSAIEIYDYLYEIDNKNPYWCYCGYRAKAIAYQNKGDIKKSIEFFKSALKYFEGTKSFPEADIYYEMALCHVKLYPDSDIKEALRYLDVSHEIAKYKESNDLLMNCLLNKARCYRLVEEYEKAEAALVEVDTICPESSLSRVYLSSERAKLYFACGDIDNAEKYLNKILTDIEGSDLYELKITSMSQRALCYFVRGGYMDAIKEFKKCVSLNRKYGLFFLLFRNHIDLVRCYRMVEGCNDDACFHSKEAVRVASEHFPDLDIQKYLNN